MAVGGCALLAFWQSRKAAVEDFSANAGGRLRLAGQYLSELVGNSKGIVDILAQLPSVAEADGQVTSYAASAESVKPLGAELSGPERVLYDECSTFIKVPQFELIYYGTRGGGFVQAPDDTLSAGFDPRKRPWYEAAQKSDGVVLTEFYQSDNGNLSHHSGQKRAPGRHIVGRGGYRHHCQYAEHVSGYPQAGQNRVFRRNANFEICKISKLICSRVSPH